MKQYWFAFLSLAVALPVVGADALSNEKDKISYAIGMQVGRSITNSQIDLNIEAFASAVKTIMSGGQPLLDENGYRDAMTALQNQLQAKQAERMKQIEAKNKEALENLKKEGAAFLEANKKNPGVVTTPSGLQYKVIATGTGPKPTMADKVVAHYRGTLMDGTEFDSSYRKGEPAELGVNGVIKGWSEALQLMPVGSKWQLFIPSDLAYGDAGRPPQIRPGAVLQFDLELISIKPKDPEAQSSTNAPAPEKKN